MACSVMKGTLYWLPHSSVLSPLLWALIPNLSVICDQMHGNSLRIYPFPGILYTPFCLTTRQCTWLGTRIEPCSFNLSLHQETKEKGRNDWNKREKYLKKVDTQLLKLFFIMYTPNPYCSGVYLSQVHGTRSRH